MGTRKTSVEIDEELLDEVRTTLDTTTIRETIHEAFMEVLRARARRRHIEELRTMRGLDLDDPAIMRGAWRS